MKNKYFLALTVILALALGACAPAVAGQSVPVNNPEPSISVNGVGTVKLEPDMATVTIGVFSQDAEAEAAVAQNNEQTQAVMDALGALGIAPEDMQTSNFNVNPRQDYDQDGNLVGVTYEVRNSLRVTVSDLDILGDVLDAVVDAGANDISGVSFDASDRETAMQDALRLAMENARQRADVLAEAAGVEISGVQNASTYLSTGGGQEVVERAAFDTAASAVSVPVSPGQLEIRVEVNVSYLIQ